MNLREYSVVLRIEENDDITYEGFVTFAASQEELEEKIKKNYPIYTKIIRIIETTDR